METLEKPKTEWVKIEKGLRLTRVQIVEFQIRTFCFLKKIALSESEINCLTGLAFAGQINFALFCTQSVEMGFFSSAQTVRNVLNKLIKMNMVLSNTGFKKKIVLNPGMEIQVDGNILLEYKFVCHDLDKKDASENP